MLALFLAGGPRVAAAQDGFIVAAGRVVRIGAADTTPAAGVEVVLHRIGRDRQAPIDTVRTDAAGRFRFLFPADTTALHLLTSRHHGIQYFSEPVHTNPARPDTALVLAVHDTSSRQPVVLAARHIVLSAPAPDGTRNVVELLALRNDGPLTRVPADTGAAVWSWRIPAGTAAFTADEGELTAGALELRGDSVLVHAPLPPGLREITVEYLLPAGRAQARFPFDAGAETVNLLVEDIEARVTAPGLMPAESLSAIQERRFRRWSGSVRAGETISAVLPVRGRWANRVLAALIAVVALGLVLGAVRLARGTAEGVRAAPDSADPDGLLDELARLDAARTTSAPLDPDAEREQAERRAELKARLASALAPRRGRP